MHWDKYAPEEIDADDPRFLKVVEPEVTVPPLADKERAHMQMAQAQYDGYCRYQAAGMQQQSLAQRMGNPMMCGIPSGARLAAPWTLPPRLR